MTTEERKQYNKQYRLSPKGKKNKKRSDRKYHQSPKGKDSKRRYNQSSGGKEYRRNYQKHYQRKDSQSRKTYMKEYLKAYIQSPKGKEAGRRRYAKRKHFGFIPLNKPFEGCEGHHIDFQQIIYIPKTFHRSIWHSLNLNINMEKINKLAFDYLEMENKAEINKQYRLL